MMRLPPLMRAADFVFLLLLVGCGDRASQPGPTEPPPPRDVGAPDEPTSPDVFEVDARWACAADGDCTSSCRWGAVNRAWYHDAAKDPAFVECEDGCANQVSEAPRCEQGGCVAYQSDPSDPSKVSRDDACTRRVP